MTRIAILRLPKYALALAFMGLCSAASGPALVVHAAGPDATDTDITSNLSGKLTSAGYTVSTNVGVPGGSLSTYKQIWDVRYNNTTPLSAGDITAYVTYLAGGGSLFVMGENTGFITRDNTIVSLIQAAGGGTITITTPNNNETVQSPFTGPGAVSAVTFLAAAGSSSFGSGSYITKDAGNIGAALVWAPGNLSNATAGTLMVVFDVNFLQASATAPLQTLTDNMIAYLAAPVSIAPAATPAAIGTPTLPEWAMLLLAGGLIFIASQRLLHKQRAS